MSQIAPNRRPIAIARIIRLQVISVNLKADRKNSIICLDMLLTHSDYTGDTKKFGA